MATIHTGALLVLSLLLFFPLPSTPIELYVTPSPSIPCHAHPCHTLSEYVENATEYFVSNTTLIFLPGEHTLKVQVNITNVTGFSMVGDPENTSLILCSESECGGFYFENVSCLNISNLSFTSNGHSINIVDVYNFQIVSCTFANSSNTALIAHNSNLLLEGNTFVSNSGGKISQTVFMPGGGIAVVYSNMTLQGHNIFLDNTCSADKCGGGAVYAEHSTVNLEGNTSFIHNTAISGGGASLLYSTVNISGRVTLSNNMVNGSGKSGNGGGLYLYDSSVIIAGRVTLTDNYASYAGGGIDMLEGNMNISGSVTLTDNYAGFAGGGINMMESNMSTSGTVSLTNNSACSFGGGINTLNGGVSIMGSVFLIDNHAGFNGGGHGGGMRVQGSTVNITGTMTVASNSADLQGGGIDLYEGSMSVSGTVTLTNNSACYSNITNSFGGGISILNGGVSITGSVIFTNNYAGCNGGGNGGGMSVQGSTMNVAGTMSFTNNSADFQGGGSTITVSRVTISGYLSFTNNSASTSGGGILMGGSNITMENATLTGNYAGIQGGGIIAEGGNLITTGRTSIVNNSAGNFGGGLLVINCNVDIPGTMSVINNSAVAYGGGITTVHSTVTISGSILLTDNHAGYYSHSTGSAYGGGVVVSRGSTLNVTGSASLTSNFADMGGGIYIASSSMSGSGSVLITNNSAILKGGGIQVIDSNITIGNVLLNDNHALQGGGISTQGKTVLVGNVSITDNSGSHSGGGLVIDHGNMDITGTVSLTRNSAGNAGGGIAISSGNISILSGSLLLTDNMARSESGGIDMQYSSILSVTHLGSVVLNNNSASLGGGGMRLDGRSQLVINGMMNFTNNYAKQGGALFVNDDTPLLYCSLDVGAACVIEDCFFQSDSLKTFLVFEGNVAEEGSVLYGGSVDSCRLEGHPGMQSSEAFDKIANYSLQPHTLSTITSNPFRVCFCNNSQPSSSGISNITAYPGQRFTTTVAAVGQRNGTMYAIVSAVAKPIQVSSLGVFEDRQSVDDKCTELHYTFFSNAPFINLMMYVDGSCSSLDGSVNRLNISVNLLSCPHAFKLSEPPCGCICEDRLQKYTNNCDINNQTIYRDGDFWVGYDNQSHGLILHPHCPFDYCQTKPINFTLNETDRQCQHDHTGLLCGACKPGLSLTLGGSQCLPCSDTYLSLLLPFAVMGLVIVLFLLVIRLTVKVGTVSGLIFYASIVGANQNTFFPPGSTNFLAANVFISWIKLDLGITTCFYDGMDAYAKTWLQFVFPIYIWGVIGLIIFISRHSTLMTGMLSNPIEVLATIFILSYGKILRTIISALSFTTLEYPNDETRLVWLYDANIMYLHGKHIPLFVVGLLFFALVYLPFTLLLLLGQWLQALSHLRILSWMNNQNLKTILDTYHHPYNKDYRYWPGLLLVIRFVLLLVFASNALRDNSGNLLAITAASFGILVWPWTIGSLYKNQYFGVYKNKYFGVLEASYILNLGILAAATNYVQQAGGNQAAVAYTSTSIAFLTFILIIIYHIYLQIKNFECWKTLCSTLRKDRQQGNGHDERNIPVVNAENAPLVTHTTLRINYGADQLREPLLDDQ